MFSMLAKVTIVAGPALVVMALGRLLQPEPPAPVPLPQPRPFLAYASAPLPPSVPGGLVFGQRWAPVTAEPEGRTVVPDLAMPMGGVPGGADEARPRTRRKTGGADLCARHGLRKVTTQNGRSWRCKR